MALKKDLLLEVGTEEIPAAFVPKALASFEASLKKRLEAARLGFAGIKAFGTPRRLVLIARGIPDAQEDCVIEVKGPSKKAAYDDAGKGTKTLEGFIKAQGVAMEDIKTIKTDKGEYVHAIKKIKGMATAGLLPEMLGAVISENVFPKSMRWGSTDVSFARPVHWITALYGSELIGVEFGRVKSQKHTFGHRFLSTGPLEVSSIDDYLAVLEKNSVVLDPDERRRIIREGLAVAAKEAGGELLPDEGLVEEVAYLVEYPVVLTGGFDSEFLTLPRDVVINAMREHQRYFSVVDRTGALLPFFITVANTKAKDMDVIRKGNERVLRARLNDAKFYFEKDVKTTLAAKVGLLKGVVFQARLGTSYEKVERFTRLSLFIGHKAGFSRPLDNGETAADFITQGFNPAFHDPSKIDPGLYSKYILGRAAMLSKADLVSGMVGEFPKLQGIMGSVYARRDNEAPEVATAIFEHYLPTVSGGVLPVSVPGALISIADKLDTIAGCFSVGLIPTGAQDPYALRRQALGIIAIMLDKDFTFNLKEIVEVAIELLKFKVKAGQDAGVIREAILEFFKERLRNQLLGIGLAFDSIDAVLATEWYDLPDAVKRIRALEAFKKNPACANLVVAFKRVSNILKGMEFNGAACESALLVDPYEKALFEAALKIKPVIDSHIQKADYEGAFTALSSIKETIDIFFDKVLVMAEDEKTRRNRLVLLDSIRSLYFKTADLSRLTVTV